MPKEPGKNNKLSSCVYTFTLPRHSSMKFETYGLSSSSSSTLTFDEGLILKERKKTLKTFIETITNFTVSVGGKRGKIFTFFKRIKNFFLAFNSQRSFDDARGWKGGGE
jgi:hypothetical protein